MRRPKTITYRQRLELLGLAALARKHNAMLNQIVKTAEAITGDEEHGHTSDAMYCDYDVDEMLRKLEIDVIGDEFTDIVQASFEAR
jgi:hypothetical protein